MRRRCLCPHSAYGFIFVLCFVFQFFLFFCLILWRTCFSVFSSKSLGSPQIHVFYVSRVYLVFNSVVVFLGFLSARFCCFCSRSLFVPVGLVVFVYICLNLTYANNVSPLSCVALWSRSIFFDSRCMTSFI